MKKILTLFGLASLLTVSSSLAVACGAADGPEVTTTIQNPHTKKFLSTNDSKFPHHTPPKGFNFAFTGINEYLMLPALTMINSDKTESQSGAKFTDAVYNNALRGKAFQQDYKNLDPSQSPYKTWTNFFKVFNSPADTYFTAVAAQPSASGTTYDRLAATVAYKSLDQSKYFKKSPYYIANADKNLVTFKAVTKALAALNTSQYLQAFENTSKKIITQEASSALVFLGNITYTFTYEGNDQKYTFNATFNNLVAHLAIAVYTTDKKTYYQGWVLAGYDYYQQSTLDKWVDTAKQKGEHQVTKINNDLYLGFHDSIKDSPTAEKGSGTDKGEFPNQTTSKTAVISYPDITFKIDLDSIQESPID